MIIERKPGPGPELQLHRERNGVGGAENPRFQATYNLDCLTSTCLYRPLSNSAGPQRTYSNGCA